MTNLLLETKLHPPPIRMALVQRLRLIDRLNAGLCPSDAAASERVFGRKLTLVSAPAGFGKTTLVSDWLLNHLPDDQPELVWLSLDEGDDDPARFLIYVLAALRKVTGVGEANTPMMPQPLPSPEQSLTPFINRLHASPARFILVLDDYHLITAQPNHNLIAFLLDHLPVNLHLVIATRADPPFSLPRLRSRGEMTELRQADLRFTRAEATVFLNERMGLSLSPADLTALEAHTEGWVAGLQLAAISLQNQSEATSVDFIRNFSGGHRYILDYLVEEVIQAQPAHYQQFLMQTAILDHLNASLCDALTGRTDSRLLLEAMDRANLFLVPLDDDRHWYRYHHLFDELLQQRLGQTQPELVPVLHRRAATWFEQHGSLNPAIRHALAAEAFDWAADLIDQAIEPAFMNGQVATMRGWLAVLPESAMGEYPHLYVYHAIAQVIGGVPLADTLSRLEKAEADGAMVSIPGEMATFRALLAILQGDGGNIGPLIEQALTNLPPDRQFFRSLVFGFRGTYLMFQSDNLVEARRLYEESIEHSRRVGSVLTTVMNLCDLGDLYLLEGNLHQAEHYYRQAIAEPGEGSNWQSLGGVANISLGMLKLETNDLTTAEEYLQRGIDHTDFWNEIGAVIAHASLARIKQANGDSMGADASIQLAHKLSARFDSTEFVERFVWLFHIRLWIERGDIAALTRWIEAEGLNVQVDALEPIIGQTLFQYFRGFEYNGLGWWHMACHRPDAAVSVLKQVLADLKNDGWAYLRVQTLAILALAYQSQNKSDLALTTLQEALALAEPGGFVRYFVELGQPMARLLYQAIEQDIHPDYAGKLLAAFEPLEPAPPRATRPNPDLVEPLSEREIEVLQLIAAGLSNRTIAQQLVLSLPTVKWHTSNIYGKLAVKNRTEAVARARSLGLLI